MPLLLRLGRFFLRLLAMLSIIWVALLTLILLVWQTLPWWSAPVLNWSRQHFAVPLYFDATQTQWNGSRIALTLKNVRWGEQLNIPELQLEMDALNSVWRFYPVMTRIQAHDIEIQAAVPEQSGDSQPQWPSWLITLPVDISGKVALSKGAIRQQVQFSLYNAPAAASHFNYGGRLQVATEGVAAPLELRWQGNIWEGQLWLNMPSQSYRAALLPWLPQGLQLGALDLEGQLWADWRGTRIQTVNGNLSLPDLALSAASSSWQLSQLRTQVVWRKAGNGWWAGLQQLSWADQQGKSLAPMNISIQHLPWQTRLWLDDLNLHRLWPWLMEQHVSSGLWENRLLPLYGRGHVKNLYFTLDQASVEQASQRYGAAQPASLWALRGDLQQVSVNDVDGIPSLIGVTGAVEADAHGGKVSLHGQPLTLAFPQLFSNGWEFNSAAGVIGWHLTDKDAWVTSNTLSLDRLGWQAKGRFSLKLPLHEDDNDQRFTLMIGVKDSDAGQGLDFVPDHTVSPSLMNWLRQAMPDGYLRSGAFLYDGSVSKSASWNERTVQLYLDLQNAQLNFSPEWPALHDANVQLLTHDESVTAFAPQAQLQNLDLSNVQVAWPKTPDDHRLSVATAVSAALPDVQDLLLTAPFADSLTALKDWQMTGSLTGQVALQIPLAKNDPALDIKVDTRLGSAQLLQAKEQLQVDDIHGDLHYDSSKGLFTDTPLQGSWRGQNVQAQLVPAASSKDSKGAAATTLKVTGHSALSDLAQWQQLSLPDWITGDLDWVAMRHFCQDDTSYCQALHITSDLQGVSVDLPAPLAKKANAAVPLQLDIEAQKETRVTVEYGDLLHAKARFQGNQAKAVAISVGGEAPQWPKNAAVEVAAKFAELNPTDWIAAVSSLSSAASNKASVAGAVSTGEKGDVPDGKVSLPISARIVTDNLHWLGRDWGAATASYDPKGVLFSGDSLDGRVSYDAGRRHLDVNLSRLLIPEVDDKSKQSDGEQEKFDDPLAQVDPRQWPTLTAQVGELKFGKWPLGSWQLRGKPSSDGYQLLPITANLGSHGMDALMSWHRDSAQSTTQLKLDVHGDDLGELISRGGYAKSLTSKNWQLTANVGWPGSPAAFALSRLSGQSDLKLAKGEILKTSTESNALKIFNIFNFNQIGRRLTLDFRDLFSSGISYDTWTSSMNISNGVMTTREPTRIQGGGADIEANGTLDLVHDTVDQHVNVTLPITSALPIAGLLAGLPQVGGALFILDKLTGDRLSKIATVKYHIKGKLGEEDVQLEGAGGETSDAAESTESHDKTGRPQGGDR